MSKLRITDCPTNDICELYLKLAEQIEAYKQADHEASEIIAELKHENKRLQEENEKLKKRQITKNGFICDCEQNAKYKQALEEIKKIIKHEDYFGCNFQYDREIAHPIINEINEVLNDRN